MQRWEVRAGDCFALRQVFQKSKGDVFTAPAVVQAWVPRQRVESALSGEGFGPIAKASWRDAPIGGGVTTDVPPATPYYTVTFLIGEPGRPAEGRFTLYCRTGSWLRIGMTPAAKCRRLATMLRNKAEQERDPEIRAEWKCIARGYLILANKFERSGSKDIIIPAIRGLDEKVI